MEPPIPREEQDWLLDALAYLVQRRGADPLVANPLLEPSDRFFPDRWEPSKRVVLILAKRLLLYAGLESLDAHVSTFSQPAEVREFDASGNPKAWRHEGAAAWFAGIEGGRCLFGVATEYMAEPEVVVATMCHEVAHAYRRFHGLEVDDRDAEECLTDVTTVYLGFGVLTTNGAYLYRAFGGMDGTNFVTGWSHQHGGYLPPEAMSFLLAAQVVTRRSGWFERRHVAGLLGPDQASSFRAALPLLRKQQVGARLGVGAVPRRRPQRQVPPIRIEPGAVEAVVSRPSRKAAPEARRARSPKPNPTPSRRGWRRAAIWFAGLAALVALVTFGMAQFQPLYLLNPTQHEARVTVSGKSSVIPAGKRVQIHIAEGEHQVRVRLANGYEHATSIEVTNGFRERFFRRSVFAFVVLGSGALFAEDHYYSANPVGQPPPPPVVVAGREFYAFRDVDFAFEGAPDKIRSTTRSAPITRLRVVNAISTAPEKLILDAMAEPLRYSKVQVRDFAEGLLRGGHRSSALVDAYLEYCFRSECIADAQKLVGELGLAPARASAE